MPRIEAQSLVEVGDGTVEITEIEIGTAATVVLNGTLVEFFCRSRLTKRNSLFAIVTALRAGSLQEVRAGPELVAIFIGFRRRLANGAEKYRNREIYTRAPAQRQDAR